MSTKHPESYHAFLVRIWKDGLDEHWRVTLDDPHSGQQVGFSDIAEFVAYIRRLTEPNQRPEVKEETTHDA